MPAIIYTDFLRQFNSVAVDCLAKPFEVKGRVSTKSKFEGRRYQVQKSPVSTKGRGDFLYCEPDYWRQIKVIILRSTEERQVAKWKADGYPGTRPSTKTVDAIINACGYLNLEIGNSRYFRKLGPGDHGDQHDLSLIALTKQRSRLNNDINRLKTQAQQQAAAERKRLAPERKAAVESKAAEAKEAGSGSPDFT